MNLVVKKLKLDKLSKSIIEETNYNEKIQHIVLNMKKLYEFKTDDSKQN